MEESQRLESLGVLASGIAHDFNNLLAAILGNNSLCASDLPPEAPQQEYLKEIHEASNRAAWLYSQMLAYAGKGKMAVEQIYLSRFTQDAVQLLRVAVGSRAELAPDFAPNLPPVEGDRSQFQQIVMNLALNAAEAISKEDGVITVRTSLFQADAAFLSKCRVGDDLSPGEYVLLEVADNGEGMSEQTLAHIFDPLFTTKFQGRGLGLSVVLSIVRSHGGALGIESAPGQGTVFRVLFPRAGSVATSSGAVSTEAAAFHSSGRALVVDDERCVRQALGALLKRMGFDVISAGDGREAVAAVEREGSALRLVVMDLTMPNLSRLEAFARIRPKHPDLPILLMSGYNSDEVSDALQNGGPVKFIHKPFDPMEFRTSI